MIRVEAFARIRAVTDDVAQTVNLRDSLSPDIGHHGLQCLKIGVDVADQGSLHARLPFIES